MRRGLLLDAVGLHPALVGGARRGIVVAAVGFATLCGAAWAAAWQSGRGADADLAGAYCLGIAGVLLATLGLADAWIFHEFRLWWERRGGCAWRLTPGVPSEGDERRSYPLSSSAPWTWVVFSGAASVLVAYAFLTATPSPRHRIAAVSMMIVTQLALHAWRWSFGCVVATACSPDDGLRTGHIGTIALAIDSSRSEFPPESFSFELQCVRAKSPLLWVFPRRETVATVEPLTRDVTGIDRLRSTWRLEFEPPAGAPAADLLARPAVYWRLCVEAHGPRAAYRETLLVAVFAGGADTARSAPLPAVNS